MKKLFVAIISVGLLQAAYAGNGYGYGERNKSTKFTMAFNAGVAVPLGAFASKDSVARTDSTHAHGYAKTGFQFNLDISYRFFQNVGLVARIGGAICQFDVAGYTQGNNVPADFTVGVDGKHYIGEYLIGPYFYLPASDIVSFEIKLMGGVVSSSYPEYGEASNLPNNYTSFSYKYTTASDFGYALSVGARFKIQENAAVMANLSYTGSTIGYQGLLVSESTPTNLGFTNLDSSLRTMSLGIFSATLGVAISF